MPEKMMINGIEYTVITCKEQDPKTASHSFKVLDGKVSPICSICGYNTKGEENADNS
jgi:hypothetical protein